MGQNEFAHLHVHIISLTLNVDNIVDRFAKSKGSTVCDQNFRRKKYCQDTTQNQTKNTPLFTIIYKTFLAILKK